MTPLSPAAEPPIPRVAGSLAQMKRRRQTRRPVPPAGKSGVKPPALQGGDDAAVNTHNYTDPVRPLQEQKLFCGCGVPGAPAPGLDMWVPVGDARLPVTQGGGALVTLP